MSGRIFQIQVSSGGVPKGAIAQGLVTAEGISGDDHHDREHHGGPDRALCLYSLERILDLQAEGHPVYPGSLGENITCVGIPWGEVVPGVRLSLGSEVMVEITRYTTPCRTIAGSFRDGRFSRVSQKERPGTSRVYARVLRGGVVRAGDPLARL